VARRSDQVFQLSLTEIAFTICFILLLLLGYLVFKEQTERKAAEEALAMVKSFKGAKDALDTAKQELAGALRASGSSNPDDVITRLIAASAAKAERDRLRKRVEDLEAQLTALTELQKLIANATSDSKQDVIAEEVASALALQEHVRRALDDESEDQAVGQSTPGRSSKAVESSATKSASGASGARTDATESPTQRPLSAREKEERARHALSNVRDAILAAKTLKQQLQEQLGKDLKPGQEKATVREVVTAAKNYGELAKSGGNLLSMRKENSDLRGQVAFLKNRLDSRGGRDYPPCWADENGKVEFLFAIELKQDAITLSPAWPPRREADAKALAGIAEVLAQTSTYADFRNRVAGIFGWSRKQDPECRHYVQLKSSIADAVQSDRARLLVENYFYKVEARR
jgi:predicted Rdx family selenoprotein